MCVIRGDEALADFRRQWTGEQVLGLLARHGGRLRVNWPVGVGKSHNIDDVAEAAVRSGRYDLVVALFPTRRLIDERRWVREPPADVRVVNLRPRPGDDCGPDRDRQWRQFERAGLGALGRARVCGGCPLAGSCPWPGQYGKALKGAQVVFGTHAHLERSPRFLLQLREWAGAGRALALLDEVQFLTASYRRTVPRRDLELFVDALRRLGEGGGGRTHRDWLYKSDLLLKAGADDLRAPDWRLPPVYPDWALRVQAAGHDAHGRDFRFVAHDLVQFGLSPPESRERTGRGELSFAAPPYLGLDFILYSGTAHTEFTRFRSGADLASPFDGHRFEHPGTVWYNLASRTGTKGYFPRHAPQVLDFFAELVARRLREGRRPLLVAKKCFLQLCAEGMEQRLRGLGLPDARVVTGGRDPGAADRWAVPLIGYGAIGTNQFEDCDAVYCLTGYYVTEKEVDEVLQDVLASDGFVPIRISNGGLPRRRRAGVASPADRVYDVDRLAQLALGHLETDVVLQAVGRVRPYTRPREVFTFQCAAHPWLEYTREFHNLGEAREYFDIPTHRGRGKEAQRNRVQATRREGHSQSQAASLLGVSLSTVKRYWN